MCRSLRPALRGFEKFAQLKPVPLSLALNGPERRIVPKHNVWGVYGIWLEGLPQLHLLGSYSNGLRTRNSGKRWSSAHVRPISRRKSGEWQCWAESDHVDRACSNQHLGTLLCWRAKDKCPGPGGVRHDCGGMPGFRGPATPGRRGLDATSRSEPKARTSVSCAHGFLAEGSGRLRQGVHHRQQAFSASDKKSRAVIARC